MSLYKELVKHMQDKYNCSFHVDRMDQRDKEILKSLCKLIDERIKANVRED